MARKKGLYDLIVKRRTTRLFKSRAVRLATIRKVINAARVAPSAANLQFIEYLVITDKRLKERIFAREVVVLTNSTFGLPKESDTIVTKAFNIASLASAASKPGCRAR